MILAEEKNQVQVSQAFKQTAFKINREQVSHVLQLVSSKLYSNKKKAAVTEILSNAYDAHVAAGKADVPFEIHLPNTFNPVFRVVDFGISMDENEVENIYSGVGLSTKTATNDQIGCFGIGKLAVLGVAESYNLICGKNGIKNSYVIYPDEDRLPQITPVGQEATDWTGVEVSFSVKQHEWNDLYQVVREAIRFYKVKPKVLGASNFQVNEPKYAFEGKDWGVTMGSYEPSLVIIGNTSYPLDDASLNLSQGARDLIRCGLHLRVPIGEVAITPTRESLSYTPKTIAYLKPQIEAIVTEIQKVYDAKFASCKNIWEAKIQYHTIFNSLNSYMQNILSRKVTWNGISISSNRFEWNSYDDRLVINRYSNRHSANFKPRHDGRMSSFGAGENIRVVVDDTSDLNQLVKYLRCFFYSNQNVTEVYVLKYKDAKAEQEVVKSMHLETVPVTLASTIPIVKIPRTSPLTPRNPKHVSKCFVYKEQAFGYRSDFWEIQEVDLDNESGVYVEIERFMYKNAHGESTDGTELASLLASLKTIGVNVGKVYGFKPSVMEKIKTNSNWVNLWPFAKTEIEKIVKNEKISKKYADRTLALKQNGNYTPFVEIRKMATGLSATSALAVYMDTYEDMLHNTTGKRIDEIKALCDSLRITLDSEKPTHNLEQLYNEVLATYPLLNFVDEYQSRYKGANEFRKAVAQYIIAINK